MTAVLAGISDSTDYLPFGELLSGGGSTTHKFTGKERDAESNLDYFGARYYASNVGRFSTPDSPFADQHAEDPQSWNLYAYTRNNPLNFVETNGREIKYATDLKNPDDVKAVVSAMLTSPDPNVRSQLSAYDGKDKPDLIIQSGNLNPNGPLTVKNDDGSTTTTTTNGLTDPQWSTTSENGGPPETHMTTTMTIDNGVSGIDKIADVVSHESTMPGRPFMIQTGTRKNAPKI
jgi:RHS repeat-associated protein